MLLVKRKTKKNEQKGYVVYSIYRLSSEQKKEVAIFKEILNKEGTEHKKLLQKIGQSVRQFTLHALENQIRFCLPTR